MGDSDWSGRRTFLVVAGVTLGAFLGWLLVLFLAWRALAAFGVATDFWTMLSALSGAAGVTAVISGGYFAFKQMAEAANQRYLGVADRLFEELNSEESIAARRWVIQKLPTDPAEGLRTLNGEGRVAVKRVLNSLDRVAFLTQAGWIPLRMVLPWMTPMIVKVWAKLGPYVEYESARRLEPDYYKYARELADQCCKWRSEHGGEEPPVWVENAL